MEICDRAITGYQKPPSDHWTDAHQYDFQLIDGGEFGHAEILAISASRARGSDNLPQFFPLSKTLSCVALNQGGVNKDRLRPLYVATGIERLKRISELRGLVDVIKDIP